MVRYFVCAFLFISLQHIKAQSPIRPSADSVKVSTELIIHNSTSNIQGYLYNSNNGKTEFRKVGNAIQFTVGTTGFPVAGDSVFTNNSLAGKNIKVWRNGLFQTENVSVNTIAGKVIFRPAFVQAERIYIEALNSIDL
jgi:hypothetical protein